VFNIPHGRNGILTSTPAIRTKLAQLLRNNNSTRVIARFRSTSFAKMPRRSSSLTQRRGIGTVCKMRSISS